MKPFVVDNSAEGVTELWKKALAQTPEEILDDVLSGEGRAGFTAIALALYATPTSIEIINANAIYNKHLSGDDAIKQCHKVLIEEHLGGGRQKSRTGFAILFRGHYYIGYTIKNGVRKHALQQWC